MDMFQIIREIVLGLCLTFVLPVTVYWGVNTVHQFSQGGYEAVEKEAPVEHQSKDRSWHYSMFLASLIIGVGAIICGALSTKLSISFGLISGGLITLMVSAIHGSYNSSLLNFSIFMLLFLFFIVICLRGSRSSSR